MKLLVVLLAMLTERHWQSIGRIRQEWPVESLINRLWELPLADSFTHQGRFWFVTVTIIVAYYVLLGAWIWGLLWGVVSLLLLIYSIEEEPDSLTFDAHLREIRLLSETAEVETVREFHQQFVREQVYQLGRGFFPALFWFVITGPVGALFYIVCRSFVDWENFDLEMTGESGLVETEDDMASNTAELKSHGEMVLHFLEWVPVRIHGVVMALLGDFNETIGEWLESLAETREDPAVSVHQYAILAVHPLPAGITGMADLCESIERQSRRLKLLMDRLIWGWLAVVAVLIIVMD